MNRPSNPYFGGGIINNGQPPPMGQAVPHRLPLKAQPRPQNLPSPPQFRYTGEGWGITRTSRELITSDGTSTLRFRNPKTFAETRSLLVHDGPTPIDQINELDYIHGIVYANIWHSDRIAQISPADGHVLAWIDCTGLLPANQRLTPESVLNGIAFDPQRNRLFVTGKQWPAIFEIKVIPQRP